MVFSPQTTSQILELSEPARRLLEVLILVFSDAPERHPEHLAAAVAVTVLGGTPYLRAQRGEVLRTDRLPGDVEPHGGVGTTRVSVTGGEDPIRVLALLVHAQKAIEGGKE